MTTAISLVELVHRARMFAAQRAIENGDIVPTHFHIYTDEIDFINDRKFFNLPYDDYAFYPIYDYPEKEVYRNPNSEPIMGLNVWSPLYDEYMKYFEKWWYIFFQEGLTVHIMKKTNEPYVSFVFPTRADMVLCKLRFEN